MQATVYDKLEWNLLLRHLAQMAQTQQGRDLCLQLKPLERSQITMAWQSLVPLRDLIKGGYVPPLDEIPDLTATLKGARLGQVLDAEDFYTILHLLNTVAKVARFIRDFAQRCPPLERYSKLIYSLPELSRAIERSVGPEGEILDTASSELARLRKTSLALRKKIEQTIRQVLVDDEIETYIQDKFFTIRAERYVVPIRLDGRGRVKGSIYDTSDSGQTLFMEPAVIAPMNEQLLELQLSEKLEIIRIFRELSSHVASEIDILVGNYQYLIDLDVLVAKARLAHQLDAGPITISDEPTLQLVRARHPLLQLTQGKPPVANDICLHSPDQTSLIISGPNAGGKTVVLKTTGLIILMMQCGLLVPADEQSVASLFDQVFVVLGDPQDIEASLSTFSGQLMSLKPVLERANRRSLVLLDELAVGTDPQTASAMAQAILEDLADKQAHTITTTHFDGLKALAIADKRFRNGSMEFSKHSLKPTYNLVLDIPGQSYGLEVAAQLGFPAKVLERALFLKGNSGSELDRLLGSLDSARAKLEEREAQATSMKLAMEQQKFHWLTEKKALEEERAKVANKVKSQYEKRIGELQSQLQESLETAKTLIKNLNSYQAQSATVVSDSMQADMDKLKTDSRQLNRLVSQSFGELEVRFDPKAKEPPGIACEKDDLKVGSRVFVMSLGREAVVTKIQEGSAPVEVQAGLLKLRPLVSELRLLGVTKPEDPKPKPVPTTRGVLRAPQTGDVPFQIVDRKNSLDLRGEDSDTALQLMWQRIDQALVDGNEQLAVIHGHGTDTLKRTIRTALAKDSPYDLDFRPGLANEGGDGVTVIKLRR